MKNTILFFSCQCQWIVLFHSAMWDTSFSNRMPGLALRVQIRKNSSNTSWWLCRVHWYFIINSFLSKIKKKKRKFIQLLLLISGATTRRESSLCKSSNDQYSRCDGPDVYHNLCRFASIQQVSRFLIVKKNIKKNH